MGDRIDRYCKTCGNVTVADAGYYAGSSFYQCETCGRRGMSDIFPPATVFHKITASPEMLAPQFIFKQWHAFDGKWGWFSLLLMDGDELNSPWFKSYEEAFTATVARLNEVVE